MRALVVRHAQSMGQRADAALTARGAAQAETLVPVLADLGAGPLYSSPMRRALDTISPFAATSGQEVAVLDALRERQLAARAQPDWREHLRRCFDEPDFAAFGGESTNDVRARLSEALEQVASGGGARPCIVSHGGAIAALFSACDPGFGYDAWQALRNPDLFAVTLAGGRVTAVARIDLPGRGD